jgi:hypothetical protein
MRAVRFSPPPPSLALAFVLALRLRLAFPLIFGLQNLIGLTGQVNKRPIMNERQTALDILFPRVRSAILRVLFRKPARSRHVRELGRPVILEDVDRNKNAVGKPTAF